MTKLRGAHVIITGGSQGIGAAFAKEAYDAGARVSLIARGEAALKERAEGLGAGVSWRSADAADEQSLSAAIDALTEANGQCDVLVCCAGTALPGRFLEVPGAEFEQQFRLNLHGAVAALRKVLPGMVAQGSGHVVLVSSTAGVIGVPGYTAYGASKYAIRGLADSLRYEVAPAGVKVSVLYPPDTDTPGFAAENLRKPPETAAISGAIKPMPAQIVAAALARGIGRNTPNITADTATRVLLRFGGILDPVLRWSFTRTAARALK